MSININKEQRGDETKLTLNGRLDTTTSIQLQEVLDGVIDGAKKVLLDFGEISYVSSAGLRVLLGGQKKAKAANKTMTLANVKEDVMEVFEMTGFADILDIDTSTNE